MGLSILHVAFMELSDESLCNPNPNPNRTVAHCANPNPNRTVLGRFSEILIRTQNLDWGWDSQVSFPSASSLSSPSPP